MNINVGQILERDFPRLELRRPDVNLEPSAIRVVMINEACAPDPKDDFYSTAPCPGQASCVLSLFREAGMEARNTLELLKRGIYLTNVLKTPKEGNSVEPDVVVRQVPVLERELSIFSDLKAVMLMGDVARKAFNLIARARSGKNALPAAPTYKIRNQEWHYGPWRVFPSYIMTGRTLQIERFKRETIADDIGRMLKML